MKEQENIIGGNGITSTEGEFNAPFDPTFWLGQLEDWFKENGFLQSANNIWSARETWKNEKNK